MLRADRAGPRPPRPRGFPAEPGRHDRGAGAGRGGRRTWCVVRVRCRHPCRRAGSGRSRNASSPSGCPRAPGCRRGTGPRGTSSTGGSARAPPSAHFIGHDDRRRPQRASMPGRQPAAQRPPAFSGTARADASAPRRPGVGSRVSPRRGTAGSCPPQIQRAAPGAIPGARGTLRRHAPGRDRGRHGRQPHKAGPSGSRRRRSAGARPGRRRRCGDLGARETPRRRAPGAAVVATVGSRHKAGPPGPVPGGVASGQPAAGAGGGGSCP